MKRYNVSAKMLRIEDVRDHLHQYVSCLNLLSSTSRGQSLPEQDLGYLRRIEP